MQQIYRRTPMTKCDFNNVALQLLLSQRGCSPVSLLHIFRTPFLKNTSGGLLLKCMCRIYRRYGRYDAVSFVGKYFGWQKNQNGHDFHCCRYKKSLQLSEKPSPPIMQRFSKKLLQQQFNFGKIRLMATIAPFILNKKYGLLQYPFSECFKKC